MKNYRGFLFDLDGVIVSTDEYHYLAWKRLADEEKIPFDRKTNNQLRGVSRADSLSIILEKAARAYGPEEIAEMLSRKNRYYQSYLAELRPGDADPEALAILAYVHRQRLALAIASSSKNTHLILKKIGLEDSFDVVIDGNDITHSKPDPEVFLKAAIHLGLKPEECLVIEDSAAGIAAAAEGGFDSYGIKDGAKAHPTYNSRLLEFKDFRKII